MVWNCTACTFANASEDAWTCEICATIRPGRERNAVPTVQVVDLSMEGGDANAAVARSAAVSLPAARRDGAVSGYKRDQPSRNMKQMNLFGQFAAQPESPKKTKSRKRKKPPLEPSATAAPTATQQSRISSGLTISKARSQSKVRWNESFELLRMKADVNMREVFEIRSLRNLQPAAIDTVLRRQNQLIVMATGGGKSLCYQLPATVLGGVTLVISPLIALMMDQCKTLNDRGVMAAVICSANSAAENRSVLERLLGRTLKSQKKGKPRAPLPPVNILYATPELVQTERFRKVLIELFEKEHLALFAIDEAHCISAWGHDFRPAYRKLEWLRTTFPSIPVMACTATATAKVIADIREALLLPTQEAPCHMSSFNRPNISYEVRFKDSLDAISPGGAMANLVEFIQEQHAKAAQRSTPCSGIVYCHKRQDTEDLARQVAKETGIRTAPYHAGLKDAERKAVQQAWTSGAIQVAFATVAFGMGIDLAHVRYVVHWSLAKTLEGFYQESGRAGRDGSPAVSVLFFSRDEVSTFSYLIQQQSNNAKDPQKAKRSATRSLDALQRMVDYCVTPCCRRQYLLRHFGETIQAKEVCNATCDYCLNPRKVKKVIDASQINKDIFSANNVNPSPANWDGQWDRPHGEGDEAGDDSDGEDNWVEGDLGVIAPADSAPLSRDAGRSESAPEAKSFTNARSILAKYEEMEAKEVESVGFVRFKPRAGAAFNSSNARGSASAVKAIPQHLRSNLPHPLQHLSTTSKVRATSVNSGDTTSIAGQLEKKAAALKSQREETAKRLRELNSSKGRKPPPPPPPLSFASGPKKSY